MAGKNRFRTSNKPKKYSGTVTIRSLALSETFEIDVPMPVGRMWSTLALEMLDAVSAFQKNQEVAVNGNGQLSDMERQDAMMRAIKAIFKEDEWWARLMPAAFGVLDEPDDTAFLQENFTMMELITAWFEAAGTIASVALGGAAVQEALGKSQDAEVIAGVLAE